MHSSCISMLTTLHDSILHHTVFGSGVSNELCRSVHPWEYVSDIRPNKGKWVYNHDKLQNHSSCTLTALQRHGALDPSQASCRKLARVPCPGVELDLELDSAHLTQRASDLTQRASDKALRFPQVPYRLIQSQLNNRSIARSEFQTKLRTYLRYLLVYNNVLRVVTTQRKLALLCFAETMVVIVEDARKLRNDHPDGPSEEDGDLVCPACGSPCDSIHSCDNCGNGEGNW